MSSITSSTACSSTAKPSSVKGSALTGWQISRRPFSGPTARSPPAPSVGIGIRSVIAASRFARSGVLDLGSIDLTSEGTGRITRRSGLVAAKVDRLVDGVVHVDEEQFLPIHRPWSLTHPCRSPSHRPPDRQLSSRRSLLTSTLTYG